MQKKAVVLIYCIICAACALVFSCNTGKSSIVKEDKPAFGIDNLNTVNLESALGEFSVYIAGRLLNTTLPAIAIINTPEQRLGNYIVDELTGSLLNEAGLRIVSRQDFERIMSEQNFQTALEFNEDSAVKIGHNLGWQTIIYGAVEPIRLSYRLSLRAVDVETGELRGTKSYLLNGSDPILICLINPDVSVQQLSERKKILEPFDGNLNNFKINISTDKAVYYDSEFLFITLNSDADCYFVVYHLDVYNNMQVIYPNRWEKGRNFLKAGISRVIPEDSSYMMCAPYGEERILVYASDRPISIPEDQYRPRSISREFINDTLRQFDMEVLAVDEDAANAELTGTENKVSMDPGKNENAAANVIAQSGDEGILNISAQSNVTATVLPVENKERNFRGVSSRGATAQVSYTILPGRQSFVPLVNPPEAL